MQRSTPPPPQEPLDQAQFEAFADSIGAPLAPWPKILAQKPIYLVGETLAASTQTLPCAPYELEAFVTRTIAEIPPQPFFCFGLSGHGAFSRALHYYLVSPPLALFLQLPVPLEGDSEAEDFRDNTLCAVDFFLEHLLEHPSRVEENQLLVTVVSPYTGSGFAWVKSGSETRPDWEEEPPTLGLALQTLQSQMD